MKKSRKKDSCEACEEAIRELQRLVARTEGVDRARVLILLGDAAIINLRPELALASFGASLDLLPPGEFPELESEALFKESCALFAMERLDEAIASAKKAAEICAELGDEHHLSLCEWRLGMYLAEEGSTPEALKMLTSARDRFQRQGDLEMAALAEMDLEKAEELEDALRGRGVQQKSRRKNR